MIRNSAVLIYPYYDNVQMLERQVENWNRYIGDLKERVSIIIVDDCSQKYHAKDVMVHCKLDKRVFRVTQNIPWGQHHARNVGAFEAREYGDNPWLFMSDIDIMLTPEEAYNLLEKTLDANRYHTFERRFINDSREPKYHLNTFFVKYAQYWAVNGYDVDYCGTYGGDAQFLSQLNIKAKQLHHGHESPHLKPGTDISGHVVTVWGYERDVIPDANTTQWSRKEGKYRDRYLEVLKEKQKTGDLRSKNPIRYPYERVL